MRNWNTIRAKKIAPLSRVSSLPMRNWNFWNCPTWFSPNPSIQPTYEELKPKFSGNVYVGGDRIQPTYEELKHLSCRDKVSSKTGIQPTYEELKQIRYVCLILIPISYPAYLWGIETGSQYTEALPGLQYPAYLWGIETYIDAVNGNDENEYPAYLWGIETIIWPVPVTRRCKRIQPTYEELKHCDQ